MLNIFIYHIVAYIHVDLEIYSLDVTDLCIVTSIPGNQNIKR